ncbi:class I SAM-dependent methyltransferase [Paenibacillus periandrae]|uniref:class I SAM-dependent methyltransferase n=1 Tax=Paenibacillus periandrae TaxID=1761741 RepID=UPI001F099458|nr:class I SAM-dependent methyltransferase [Paenibacillus periandrae]
MEYFDMLAKLGIGNAHPGGFTATLKQLEQYPLPTNCRILEVGCGTGRTSCYVAAQGHDVTGIDIRPDMIAKAKIRAEKENVSVQFMEGDAGALPFPNESFDVILVESVSIFTDTDKALSEYYRVLRTGGKLFDREMILLQPVSTEINEEITGFYHIDKLWGIDDWSALVNTKGFNRSQIEGPFLFPETSEDLLEHPDPSQQIDAGSFLDIHVWEVTSKYNGIMDRFREYIGFVLVIGTK